MRGDAKSSLGDNAVLTRDMAKLRQQVETMVSAR
jgi:hypothetical protein